LLQTAICAQLADLFEEPRMKQPIGYTEQLWNSEEYSVGCVSERKFA